MAPMDQKAAGRHAIDDISGPLLVGGVDYLIPRTNLFRDFDVRLILNTQERFKAYLEFRDQACKIAATQMVSTFNSPADLFLLAKNDEKELFGPLFAQYIAFCDRKIFLGDKGDGTLDDDILTNPRKNDIKLFKDVLLGELNHVRRYFVYRKGLLKLDFIKWNSDPQEVLRRLKTSKWSEMEDYELKRGIKEHMYLLKKLEMSKVDISELERVAMEKINSELSSHLQIELHRYDGILINNYFERMRYMNLARECAVQARLAGIILLEEALPIRPFSMEQLLSTRPNVWKTPYIEQTVKQAFDGYMGSLQQAFNSSLRRINERIQTGAARWKLIPVLLGGLALAQTSNKRP